MSFSLFILLSLGLVFAEVPQPPAGWVEIKSLEPVVLTWVKAEPEKKLNQVPTILVQEFPLTEKIKELIAKHPGKKFFTLVHDGWTQTWWPLSKSAVVVVVRNETPELLKTVKTLEPWIQSHD